MKGKPLLDVRASLGASKNDRRGGSSAAPPFSDRPRKPSYFVGSLLSGSPRQLMRFDGRGCEAHMRPLPPPQTTRALIRTHTGSKSSARFVVGGAGSLWVVDEHGLPLVVDVLVHGDDVSVHVKHFFEGHERSRPPRSSTHRTRRSPLRLLPSFQPRTPRWKSPGCRPNPREACRWPCP